MYPWKMVASHEAVGVGAFPSMRMALDATSDAAFCDFLLLPLTEEEEALVARQGVATTPIANRIQRKSLVLCHTLTTTLLSRRDYVDGTTTLLTHSHRLSTY
jgi:hypothetical protein